MDLVRRPREHRRVRAAAARDFAADLAAHPERYVAAALPALPFADRSFDLVFSSLCCSPMVTDSTTPFTALLELARVACGQVRLFPVLLHANGERYHELARLRATLASHGVGSRPTLVSDEFQRDGNEMRVLDGRTRPARRT